MLEQVGSLLPVVFVVEKKTLSDLVHILVSSLYFTLTGRQMCIYHGQLCLTNLDRATDGALVATYTQDTGTHLGQLMLDDKGLYLTFDEDYLEEAHLHVTG